MKWLSRDTVRAPYVTLCLSDKEFQRAAKHCKVDNPGPWLDEARNMAVVHTWDNNSALYCVVCLHPDAPGSDPIDVACTLVHESVHIFQRLCDSIGENKPSREFEAYSIERLSASLMREFARRGNQ